MRSSKWESIENWFIFLIVFSFNLIVAYLLAFKSGYIASEAVIRTGQAFDLIQGYNRGRQSLVSSIWWPPLPVLIQIPLVFLKFHLHRLFLNNIISSIFGALSVTILNSLFRRSDFDRIYRYLVLAIFQLNPLILFNSVNGTSQMISVLFVTASLSYLLVWLKEKDMRNFLLMTLNTSLLCLTRLEGFFYAMAVLAVIIIVSFKQKYPASQKEGLLLLYLSPAGYLISLWFLFNWLIMGDWLYFLRGTFSYLVIAGKERLIGPLGSLFIIFPFGYVFLTEFLRLQKKNSLYIVKKYILLILLIASMFPLQAFHLIKQEMNWSDRQKQEIAEISSYLAKYKEDSQILVTDFQGYLFRYYNTEARLIMHYFDLNFQEIPPGDAPLYLLIPRPYGKTGLDGVHWKYPYIYEEGTRFTILDREFGSWRVFRVIRINPLQFAM